MKRALLLLLLLITLSGLQAQDYDFLEKDWTRIAQKKEGLRISPMFLKGFLPSGEEVKPSDMMTFLMKIEYAPAIFVDLKQNPVAIVFEKASEEQMAARIKRFENFSGGDFRRNQKAPDFTINDLDGKFGLSEFKETMYFEFWFIGCSPCIIVQN